jgi:DNA-binding transcriptional LysR family regulator
LLRLGVTSSLGVSLVPRAIAVLRRERQSARLAVHLLPVRELTEALLMRRLDVGLSLSAVVVPGLEATTLGSVPCVVVLPESHPLAAQPALRPSLLANVPEIGFADWQDFGRSLDLVFEAEGVQRQLAVEVGTTVSAIAMVREGIGFAIVDGLAKDGLPPGVVARPFLPEVRRDIVLARSSELGTSSLVDRLCGILTDLCCAASGTR